MGRYGEIVCVTWISVRGLVTPSHEPYPYPYPYPYLDLGALGDGARHGDAQLQALLGLAGDL